MCGLWRNRIPGNGEEEKTSIDVKRDINGVKSLANRTCAMSYSIEREPVKLSGMVKRGTEFD